MTEVGFHFTSAERYLAIRSEGLRTGHLPNIAAAGEAKTYRGVWLWPEMPAGHDLTGQVVRTAMSCQSWNVVALEVSYDPADVLVRVDCRCRRRARPCEHLLTYWHTGDLVVDDRPWVYHRDKPSVIVTRRVPPGHVRQVGGWDLQGYVAGR